jgi:anti-anti-sigma regulatory factor
MMDILLILLGLEHDPGVEIGIYLSIQISAMDVRKASSGEGVRWYLSGSVDDDSILNLESLVMNSHDTPGSITLDLSGVEDLPSNGARGIALISKKLSMKGSSVEITGANDQVTRSLRYSGLIEDQ